VLFIGGGALRNIQPLREQRDREPAAHASKDFSRPV
jgi:hypothetical protein